MSFFRRPDYSSDTSQFIDQLKAQRPELEAEQRQGRGLLWDKPIDRDIQAEFKQGRVAQKPYVYQTQARTSRGQHGPLPAAFFKPNPPP